MKHSFIITISALALLAVSCENAEFLNRVPYTQTCPENFFQDESQFKLATIGAYETMHTQKIGGVEEMYVTGGTYFCGLPIIMNAPSDELFCYNTAADTYGQFTQMINLTFTESNTGLRKMWAAFYSGINRCNSVIENAKGWDSAIISGYVAEATFLRAFYYWYLAQTFGGVPISVYGSDGLEPRSSLETVYKYILADLEQAYKTLPAQKGKGAIGEGSATKYTAAAYIGRICNYLAACKRSGTGSELVAEQPLNDFGWVNAEKMTDMAYDYLKDVVENAPYTLADDFTNVFREMSKEEQHKECLFMSENYIDGAEGAYPSTTIFALSPGCSGVKEYGQTGAIWNRYAMPTPKIFAMFSPKDPRRDWFCTGTADGTVSAGTILEEKAADGYIYIKPFKRGTADSDSRVDSKTQTYLPFLNQVNTTVGKFRFTQIGQVTTHTQNQHCLSFPLMRLADVYLMYAEAIYYKTGDEEKARTYFRKVLLRACGKDEELTNKLMDDYHKDSFIEELLETRERELCYEGSRKYDLIRFNLLGEALNQLVNVPIATVEGKNYYAWNSYLRFEDKKLIGFTSMYFEPCVESIKTYWKPYKMWAPISSLQIAANPNLTQNAQW